MKKVLLLSIAASCISLFSNAQTTYYWTGAAGSAGAPSSWATSWNTAPNGTGTPRTISSGTDILIFDGATTAATSLFVGAVPKDSAAQLKLMNGVTVTITTTSGSVTDAATTVTYGSAVGGAVIPVLGADLASLYKLGDFVASGTSNPAQIVGINAPNEMYISNEGPVNANTSIFRVPTLYIKGNPGLTVDATSTLNIGASGTTTLSPFALVISSGARGEIFGRFNFQSRALAGRLGVIDSSALLFKSGSSSGVSAASGTGSARGYLYGNPLGRWSPITNAFSFDNNGGGITFERGSTYTHTVQQNNPLGTATTASAPLFFASAIRFMTGSNYVHTYGNGYIPYFYSNGATYGNLTWNSGGFPGSNTTTFLLNPARIDTLTITQMGSPANSSTATRVPIYGDYINNSATTVTFANMFFAGGGVSQRIAGSNTTAPITNLYVLDQSNVQLNTNITVAGSVNLLGKLDLGTFAINGSGTQTLSNNSSSNRTFSSPAGSGNVTGGVSATANSTTVQVRGIANIVVGTMVTSASHPSLIQPGTFVVSYSGSGNYVLSKPVTASADSTSTPPLSLTFASSAGTIGTASAAGIGGSFNNFANYNLGTNANYTFDAATTTPFPALAASPISAGNMVLNAPVTMNKERVTLAGALNLNNRILTLRASDTLVLSAASPVLGTLGSASHININTNTTTGANSYVQMNNVAGTAVIPVGNNGNYLPITLYPETTSSFSVSVSTGATSNGQPNGTPLTPAEKVNIVDANYIVNRTAGTGNDVIRLGFPSNLKGSGLASIQNHQLGIQRYDEPTTAWQPVTGGGDNTFNIAQAGFTNFSPFRVAVNLAATPLPVKLGDVAVTKVNGQSKITWKVYTEVNAKHYVIERSIDGRNFIAIGEVAAQGKQAYSFMDLSPAFGKNLYRVKAVDNDNTYLYSKVVVLDFNAIASSTIHVAPNPVAQGYFTVKLNNFNAGKVNARLFNNNGQMLMQKSLSFNGSNDTELIDLPSGIAKGIYQLVITDGVNTQKQTILIQ